MSRSPSRVIAYLFGPGRSNEHVNQHVVASSGGLSMFGEARELVGDVGGRRAFVNAFDAVWREGRRVAGLPIEDDVVVGTARGGLREDRAFHAVISLSREEGALSSEEWGVVARDYVRRMEFEVGDVGESSQWFAVHHGASTEGNDHVHVVVHLTRENGKRAKTHLTKVRTAKVVAEIAAERGLVVAYEGSTKEGVAQPVVRKGTQSYKRGELERAQRAGLVEPEKFQLRRRLSAAAMQASSEAEFVRLARAAGVRVRPRFAAGSSRVVTGYSAALAGVREPLWYAPSKLDRSLALPTLRERWTGSREATDVAFSAWKVVAQGGVVGDRVDKAKVSFTDLEDAFVRLRERYVRDASVGDYEVAVGLTMVLSTLSVRVEGSRPGVLARASDVAAKRIAEEHSRGRARSSVVAEAVASTLSVAMVVSKDPRLRLMALLLQVVKLAEALARARDAELRVWEAREMRVRVEEPLRARVDALDAAWVRVSGRAGHEAMSVFEGVSGTRPAPGAPRDPGQGAATVERSDEGKQRDHGGRRRDDDERIV